MKDQELFGVLMLDAPKRFKYFINRVVDAGEMYSLKMDSQWVLMGRGNENKEIIPLWPNKESALACKGNEDWLRAEPSAIDLDLFIEKWIPGINRGG